MSTLKPLGDKVVVQVVEQDEKTASGIYLPDTAKKKPQEGKVVAVGQGRARLDPQGTFRRAIGAVGIDPGRKGNHAGIVTRVARLGRKKRNSLALRQTLQRVSPTLSAAVAAEAACGAVERVRSA